jgi:hypothetical protein
LVAGALVATFTVPRAASDAATDAHGIGTGTNATNALTVNVQEIDPDNSGAVIFNLSEYGDVDWFHLTGVPCSNPYFDPADQPQPTGVCETPGEGDGYVGRTGGRREVASSTGDGLDWAPLATDGPTGTAYGGVYAGANGPVTYSWDSAAGASADQSAWLADPTTWTVNGFWNDTDLGNAYDHSPQYSGTNLYGVFYDPDQSAKNNDETDYQPHGYKISVDYDAEADRVLRFVGGAWQATASVTVTATDDAGAPAETSVPFYPAELTAGDDAVTALYTVYIPAGHGASVSVALAQAKVEFGQVTLGGAALSDQRVDFEPLARAAGIDILEAPKTLYLSDPGDTSSTPGDPKDERFIVDGWRHGMMRQDAIQDLYYNENSRGGKFGATTLDAPVLQFPGEGCAGYYTPTYYNSMYQPQARTADPLYPSAAQMPTAVEWLSQGQGGVLWPVPTSYTGFGDSNYHSPGTPIDYALATARCAGAASGMARASVGQSVPFDRYFYALVGGWGGDYYADAVLSDGTSLSSVAIAAAKTTGADWTMTLYRILVPAGTTVVVTFKMAADPAPSEGAALVFGGLAIQRMPFLDSCSLPAEFPGWDQLLSWEGADDLARAPYFQQFQLRGLLNDLIRDQDQDGQVDSLSGFEQGQLTAGYCEAKAWPDEPGQGDPADKLHPDQNGYGWDNDHEDESDGGTVVFSQEADESPDEDGDEVDPDAADQDKLKQPMAKLTKRAFACVDAEGEPYDEAIGDPNVLVGTAAGPQAATCLPLTEDSDGDPPEVAAGTTVYWLFTLENVGLFGKLAALAEPGAEPGAEPVFKVSDQILGGAARSCVLNWELAPATITSSAGFPATEITSGLGDPIWPKQARACVIAGVLN